MLHSEHETVGSKRIVDTASYRRADILGPRIFPTRTFSLLASLPNSQICQSFDDVWSLFG